MSIYKGSNLIAGNNLPTQTGQSGKFLTTNGSVASWAEVQSAPPVDEETIELNSDGELQAIGVINDRDGSTALQTWTGTETQYKEIGYYFAYDYDSSRVYVRQVTPTTSSTVYSAIGTASALTVSSVGTGTITLSDGYTYTRTAAGDLIDSTQYSATTLYNITDDQDGLTLTLLQTLYPVGSVYITTNSTCPLASLFGTWTAIGAGERYIIETNINGTEGYRIWNDGYCEQWGQANNTATGATYTLTKSYQDTNYNVQMQSIAGSYGSACNIGSITKTNASSFVHYHYSDTTQSWMWRASGYLASDQYTVTNVYNKFKRTA